MFLSINSYFCVMNFRTEINLSPSSESLLSPERPVLMFGSCFASQLSERLRSTLWDASNPLGVLYNPLSILRAIDILLDRNEEAFADSLLGHDGIIHSFLFDSRMSSGSRGECMDRFRTLADNLSHKLKRAEALFITFGTAWCWFLAENPDYVVANCHRQPDSLFMRRRLSPGEIAKIWTDGAERLHDRFPNLRLYFTVSPVRYLKEGAHGNQLSKAVLLLAVERICGTLPYCGYFPSYELLLDDLRDYRFYASDLVHPSDAAVEYIYEKFCDAFLGPDGRRLIKEGEALNRTFGHRPILPEADSVAADRRKALADRADAFARLHPGMLKPHF